MKFFANINQLTINGTFIGALILISPYLLFTHLLIDDTATSISIFGFNYEHGHKSNRIFIYFILAGLIPIFQLSLWFLECNYKWKWIILLSIFPWIDNIIRLKYSNKSSLGLFFISIALSMLLMVILIAFKKFKDYYFSSGYYNLSDLISLNTSKLIYSQFNESLSHRINITKDNYLKLLIELDEQISEIIKYKNINIHKSFQLVDYIVIAILMISASTLYWDYYVFFAFPSIASILNLEEQPFGFVDIESAVYFFSLKIAILFPILVWFFTSLNWWRFALLSPVVITVFQIWEALQNYEKADEISFIYATPWIIIVMVILLYLDRKVNFAVYLLKSKSEIQKQIEEILNSKKYSNEQFVKNKVAFEKVKGGEIISEKLKLEELIRIREDLIKNLEIKN